MTTRSSAKGIAQRWTGAALAAAAMGMAGGARAGDGAWVGASGGNWSDPANWQGGAAYAAGSGATAYFTNGAPVTVWQDLGSLTLGNLYFAGASTLLTNNAITLAGGGTSTLTVDGDAVTASVSVALAPSAGTLLVKNGSGTFLLNRYLANLSGLTLNGGLTYLGFPGNSDGLNVGSGTITVNSGATLKCGSNNQINNFAVINIASGGVYNVNGMTDNIGALTGAGVVTNAGVTLNFWLNGATRTFSGLCFGNSEFAFKTAGVFVAGASNSLQSVLFDLYNPGQLGFAPGVGTYYLGRLAVTNAQTLTLQDTAGNPIVLGLGTRNEDFTLGATLAGSGGLEKAGTGTLTLTNAQSYAGPTTVSGGTLKIGDGVNDGSIPNSASLTVLAGKTLALNTLSNQTVGAAVFGSGTITKAQNSAVALSSYNMSNGTVTVNGGTLAVNGGSYIGGSFTVNSGALLAFNGGSGTGATLNVAGTVAGPVRIAGGTHLFASAIGLNNARYEQTGGTCQFIGAQGNLNTNVIFATVSGGTLRVANTGAWPQGLGLLISGNATAVISDFSYYGQRLASDGRSHEIIVTNSASLTADSLRLISAGNNASTGTLTLAGGTFAVGNLINVVDTSTNSYILVNFNGGLLKLTTSTTVASTPYSTFRVFEGGARIDGGSLQTQINQPLVSALAGATDGGLAKSGASVLVLVTNATYTGTTTAKAGTLRTTSADGAPFGGGSLLINGGTLQFQPAGSSLAVGLAAAGAPGSTAAYGPGPSTLSLSKMSDSSVTLTLGNSGAASESVLVRTNRGVLAITPANGTAASNLGVNEKVLVNGGAATVNGMVSATVAAIGTDATKSVDFLTYSGASGLVLPTYTAGVAGGAASLANVTSATATDSAQVYALRVHGGAALTVNGGQTLTVGDGVNPAGVILNNSGSARAAITNGTLAFGASEGVVWFSQSASAGGAKISSAITGSNGLTLVGGGPSESLTLDAAGGNAYAGGTRIMAGRVDVAHSRGFGDGDVYLYGNEGWGGQFLFNFAGTMTNAFHLAGVGAQEWPNFGAVRFNANNATLSGPVELMEDARVGAYTLQSGILGGPVSGPGGLEISGTDSTFAWGQIVLKGANTYAGATRINNGTLQVAAGGTLGAGPVVDNAALLFNSDADQTVTNAISGTGRIVKSGAGRLTLAGATTCAGGIEIEGGSVAVSPGQTGAAVPFGVNGLLDLGGASLSVGHLAGTGTVSTASGAVALTVGADNSDSQYRGVIADGAGTLALNKTGTGTLSLSGKSTYGGATVVGAGTLKLQGSPTAPTNGLAYRLDASSGAGLTLSGSNVTAWADVSGAGVAFTQTLAHLQPVYVTNAVNGLGAVRFNGEATNRMVAAKAVSAQTVFIVDAVTGYMDLAGIWGRAATDSGIRANSPTSWQLGGDANDFTYGGSMFINGEEKTSFTAGAPHVLSAVSATQRTGWQTALGDYWGSSSYRRAFTGLIGEILVYGSRLSASDRQTVEAYLANKWLGVGAYAATNVLPAGTALSVSNSATLDLNGVSQAVASLSGAGTVGNGSALWSTLTVGGDNSSALFAGVIAGSNALVKAGSGTFTLSGANTFAGGTLVSGGTLRLAGGANRLPASGTVTLAAGATLDLNGQGQTLYGLGGSGSVVGGSLTVTGVTAPGGAGAVGTLTLAATPSLSGTLLVDTRPDGACDLLSVAGNLDLSALALQVADVGLMGGYSYTVAACTGNLTGSFASSNLSKAWSIQYNRANGAGQVMLVHNLGTLISIR